jgi:WD40 repeat protein
MKVLIYTRLYLPSQHLFTRWINPGACEGEYHFVSGGATSVHFWKIEGSALTKKESRAGKYKQKPILCAANLKSKGNEYKLVTGTSQGDLYIFAYDRECKNSIDAHEGPILTLAESVNNEFIISGGMDKCIKIWNQALQAIAHHKFDQNPLESPVNASVASIDYKVVDNNIVVLVGTYGGEIMEVAAKESEHSTKQEAKDRDGINFDLISACEVNVLMHSHYSGELWGVAPCPTDSDVVATGGDDCTVRLWSISENRMIGCENTGRPVRCVGWSPDGRLLAVGFHESVKGGGKVKATKSSADSKEKSKTRGGSKTKGGKKSVPKKGGAAAAAPSNDDNGDNDSLAESASCYVYLVDGSSMERVGFGGSSTAWISDIKFSPKGTMLAMGSHDKRLYVYNVPADVESPGAWKEAFKHVKYAFNKHSSAITHFDFSEDEQYFQTNCQAYELLFGEAATGKQKTSATELRDYNAPTSRDSEEYWSTWTCTLGWPVQGIWTEGADGSDINAVDRSLIYNLVVTADDFGLVKLFRYPCVDDGAKCNTYQGHSSHVTNVRWTKGEHLMSVGGNDKCLFVWKLTM